MVGGSSLSGSGHHSFATRKSSLQAGDTPLELPEFSSSEEYLTYMETVSALPQGFSVGTAKGKFVSVEAPALGELPIKATVIHLTEGPTDNWAAVFTQNKVCICIGVEGLVFSRWIDSTFSHLIGIK